MILALTPSLGDLGAVLLDGNRVLATATYYSSERRRLFAKLTRAGDPSAIEHADVPGADLVCALRTVRDLLDAYRPSTVAIRQVGNRKHPASAGCLELSALIEAMAHERGIAVVLVTTAELEDFAGVGGPTWQARLKALGRKAERAFDWGAHKRPECVVEAAWVGLVAGSRRMAAE